MKRNKCRCRRCGHIKEKHKNNMCKVKGCRCDGFKNFVKDKLNKVK